ncbi:aldehyde dehydrogenase [uncultured Paludibaculum sp.]|uniref:aldehyde dehydrogenase n=1 Tax=uncultured Paludibaculum sp. TaxID=1765020 RepID=UPI002AAAD72F|nr:aldehyde dehydrogenase [uncultured Paludibaculum sp.]
MTFNRDQLVAEIAEQVLLRLQQPKPAAAPASSKAVAALGDGVLPTVDAAVKAAAEAQLKIAALSLEGRGRIITAIRQLCEQNKQEWARLELEETGLGRLDHKIAKLENVKYVLGVEAMSSQSRSDASGLCIIERAPWGVIGMVLPATHSVPTMASNAINVIASGNTAVFSPHPAAAKVAARALQVFNREIEKLTGIANSLVTMQEPSIRAAEEMFHHPGIALLCVTGGPAVVRAAGKSGKRVIAAGPGNPPVVVDETAQLDEAAKAIIAGASFDNNLLCIGEKEVFVVAQVWDAFIAAMRRAGAVELDVAAVERLTDAAFKWDGEGKGCGHAHLRKELIGKDVSVLAEAAGVKVPAGTPLLFGETSEDHAFVQEEQMMPFLPLVKVKDVNAGIAASVKAEHGYRHTALIHSRNIENVTKMARAMNTTLFVHNAPCTAALGTDGAGYLSFSIATPTGEGVTTPLTFTRERQLTIGGGALRVI